MGDPTLNQDEIDALLAEVADPTEGPAEGGGAVEELTADDLAGLEGMLDDPAPAKSAPAAPPPPAMDDFGGDDLAAMLDDSPAPAPIVAAPAASAAHAAAPAAISHPDFATKNIETLLDVPLQVVVELGRTEMPIQKVLDLGPGSVVELNRLSGEPINIMVNGKLVARGEVVVVDENFGIKITNIISPMERLSQLN